MTPVASPSRFSRRLRSALEPDYQLGAELPGAGMSRVFRARDMTLGRPVALKIVHPDVAAGIGIEHFRREIAVTAHLLHPHIVPLLAAGDVDGLFYYTMPLFSGESLRTRLETGGPLPLTTAIRLGYEVASALDYAHRQGVVHRDIKPENILLHDGHAMVLDFGIAAALEHVAEGRMHPGLQAGTPAYMSPEQREGRPVDGRADIYALGRMIVESIAGRLPAGPRLDRQTPGVGRVLRDILERAIAMAPDDRYATAGEFRDALRPHAVEDSVACCPRIARVVQALRRLCAWLDSRR